MKSIAPWAVLMRYLLNEGREGEVEREGRERGRGEEGREGGEEKPNKVNWTSL